MKIIHIVSSGGLYGKERVIETLVQEQIDDGHDVSTIIMGDYAVGEEIEKFTTQVYYFPTLGFYEHKLLKTLIRQMDPDIIHSHDYKSGILMALRKLTNRKAKVVRTLHGYTNSGSTFSKLGLYEMADKVMLGVNDKNIGVSASMNEDLGIDIINNGVSDWNVPSNFTPQIDILSFIHDADFVIGCMARLSEEKNLEELVKAIYVLPDRLNIKLLLFGDGPKMETLKYWIDEHNISDKVLLVGFDPNAKYYLSYMDVYIQPSLTEGTPISVLEALSAGVPTIVTSVGGMKPLIKEGASLVCGPDHMSIAKAIIDLQLDDQVRNGLEKIGHEVFNQKYSGRAMTSQYEKVYQSLTKEW